MKTSRTNAELKKSWLNKIGFNENYCINICMMDAENCLTLNIDLYINDEFTDTETLMEIENAEQPTKEMKAKMRAAARYFKTHFKNVNVIDKVILV